MSMSFQVTPEDENFASLFYISLAEFPSLSYRDALAVCIKYVP